MYHIEEHHNLLDAYIHVLFIPKKMQDTRNQSLGSIFNIQLSIIVVKIECMKLISIYPSAVIITRGLQY